MEELIEVNHAQIEQYAVILSKTEKHVYVLK